MNAMFPLEYYAETFWANLQAIAYTTVHWGTRIYVDETYIEVRDKRFIGGTDMRPRIQFIGVVRGYAMDDTLEVVRTYYGKPRF